MSVIIVGGHERMERQYTDICKSFDCDSKVYTKTAGKIKCAGIPDLLVLFTGTVSHKMLRSFETQIKGKRTQVAYCHSSSASALKNVLKSYCKPDANDV